MFTLRMCDEGFSVSQTRRRRLPADPEYCSDLPADWSPSPVRTHSGVRGDRLVESFARGDRVYVRGDVLEQKDVAIKAASRCVMQWSPPPVDQPSAPEMRSTR